MQNRIHDTGITYDAIETAAVGYCYGDSTSGQVCIAHTLRRPICSPLTRCLQRAALQPRPDRHSHCQRKQQLLDWFVRALPGQ